MDGMPDPKHAQLPAAPEKCRRWWHRRRTAGTISLPLLLVLLGLGIAAAAFFMLFITVYALLYPVMGWYAAIVPVAGEIAFAYLFLTGVYLAIRKLPSGILRPVMMGALMAGSVVLQVWAARHSVPDATGHLVVVAGFFGIMLVGKSTILSVLGGKVKADRIGLGQWLAHPVHSARLWRWQQTWGEPSRKAADARYRVLLYAITVAQADKRIGRAPGWRRELPPTLRYELSMGALDCAIDTAQPGWQETVRGHVTAHLALLEHATPDTAADDSTPRQEHASPDASAHDTPDASQDASSTPASKTEPRQRTRQPTATERARQTATVKRLLERHPDWTLAEVAVKAEVSERTVSRIRNAPAERAKPLTAVR
jgi:hypothetical protein